MAEHRGEVTPLPYSTINLGSFEDGRMQGKKMAEAGFDEAWVHLSLSSDDIEGIESRLNDPQNDRWIVGESTTSINQVNIRRASTHWMEWRKQMIASLPDGFNNPYAVLAEDADALHRWVQDEVELHATLPQVPTDEVTFGLARNVPEVFGMANTGLRVRVLPHMVGEYPSVLRKHHYWALDTLPQTFANIQLPPDVAWNAFLHNEYIGYGAHHELGQVFIARTALLGAASSAQDIALITTHAIDARSRTFANAMDGVGYSVGGLTPEITEDDELLQLEIMNTGNVDLAKDPSVTPLHLRSFLAAAALKLEGRHSEDYDRMIAIRQSIASLGQEDIDTLWADVESVTNEGFQVFTNSDMHIHPDMDVSERDALAQQTGDIRRQYMSRLRDTMATKIPVLETSWAIQ